MGLLFISSNRQDGGLQFSSRFGPFQPPKANGDVTEKRHFININDSFWRTWSCPPNMNCTAEKYKNYPLVSKSETEKLSDTETVAKKITLIMFIIHFLLSDSRRIQAKLPNCAKRKREIGKK